MELISRVHVIDVAQEINPVILVEKLEGSSRTKRKLENAIVFESEGEIGAKSRDRYRADFSLEVLGEDS